MDVYVCVDPSKQKSVGPSKPKLADPSSFFVNPSRSFVNPSSDFANPSRQTHIFTFLLEYSNLYNFLCQPFSQDPS